MTTHLRPLIAIFAILFTLLAAHVSQAKQIKVALIVDASDNIKPEILRLISGELRKFDDVVIGFDNFDYQISVVALILSPYRVESTESESNGQGSLDSAGDGPLYVFSLVVAKSPAGIRSNPAQYAAILGHTLQTDGHLDVLCKYVATETNSHVFAPERKARGLSWEVTPKPSPP